MYYNQDARHHAMRASRIHDAARHLLSIILDHVEADLEPGCIRHGDVAARGAHDDRSPRSRQADFPREIDDDGERLAIARDAGILAWHGMTTGCPA